MKLILILLVAMYATCSLSLGQNSPTAAGKTPTTGAISSHLELIASAKVLDGGALVGRGRCDDGGNIYIRLAHVEDHSGPKLPVKRISPDGSVAATFKVADAGPDIHAMDFFVSGSGEVYEGAWDQGGSMHVLEFSSDGSLKSNLILDTEPPVFPYQIAVFKSGELLLSGLHGRHLHTPFTAVFDAKGRLIKEIYEPEDEATRQKADAGDPALVRDTGNSNYSVDEGDVVAGSDGNVYLLRALSPALIYVISSKGEVVRKLQIDSPDPGLVARRLRSLPGRLAISFLERSSTIGITRVVDFQGNPIVDYASDDERISPGLPGCYTHQGFTFVSVDGHDNVTLRQAEPR